MSRILCIHLPLWPIQRRVAVQPELRRRPIALLAADGNRGERVVVCSPAARQEGIRIDMPVAEALAVARNRVAWATRPPLPHGSAGASPSQIHVLPHEPAADRAALEDLAAWCEQFSPIVGLEDADEPQCLLLEVTGLGPLFGGEPALAVRVARQFHHRGYHIRLGLADTLGAAWAVANISPSCQGWVRGGGVGNNFNPQTILPPGQTLAALANFPPAALRLPPPILETLSELGVAQIGQLMQLPRADLARLGEVVGKRLNQAEGRAREVIIHHRPQEPFAASWALEHPTENREALAHVLRFLSEHLCRQLDEQDRGAVQLVCQLKLCHDSLEDESDASSGAGAGATGVSPVPNHHSQRKNRRAVRFTIGLFQPTARAGHLLELIHLQLERRRYSGAVRHVRLHAVTTAPLAVRQGELFADRRRDARRHRALLVDRLSSRLGPDSVLAVRPLSDALPERAVGYAPLTQRGRDSLSLSPKAKKKRRSSSQKDKETPEPAGIISQRPLTIYSPPLPLEALAVAPDGPPLRFQIHRRGTGSAAGQLPAPTMYHVARHWGPERIETSWWRGRTVRRDYWRVETETAQRFWLFRRLRDGKWFLHGEFA